MPESEAIRLLSESVDKLAQVIEDEKQARRLTVIVSSTLIALVAVLATIGTAVNWHQLQVQKTDREAARITACESYNADTVDKINAQWLAVARMSDNPDAMELVVPLLLDRRDCSQSGIAAYFDQDPATDPFVPVVTEDYE